MTTPTAAFHAAEVLLVLPPPAAAAWEGGIEPEGPEETASLALSSKGDMTTVLDRGAFPGRLVGTGVDITGLLLLLLPPSESKSGSCTAPDTLGLPPEEVLCVPICKPLNGEVREMVEKGDVRAPGEGGGVCCAAVIGPWVPSSVGLRGWPTAKIDSRGESGLHVVVRMGGGLTLPPEAACARLNEPRLEMCGGEGSWVVEGGWLLSWLAPVRLVKYSAPCASKTLPRA